MGNISAAMVYLPHWHHHEQFTRSQPANVCLALYHSPCTITARKDPQVPRQHMKCSIGLSSDANISNMENITICDMLETSVQVVICVGPEGYHKIGKSKKDPGFGRFTTSHVSSSIFIQQYSKTKKLEWFY